jgi:hypothetical protein
MRFEKQVKLATLAAALQMVEVKARQDVVL